MTQSSVAVLMRLDRARQRWAYLQGGQTYSRVQVSVMSVLHLSDSSKWVVKLRFESTSRLLWMLTRAFVSIKTRPTQYADLAKPENLAFP